MSESLVGFELHRAHQERKRSDEHARAVQELYQILNDLRKWATIPDIEDVDLDTDIVKKVSGIATPWVPVEPAPINPYGYPFDARYVSYMETLHGGGVRHREIIQTRHSYDKDREHRTDVDILRGGIVLDLDWYWYDPGYKPGPDFLPYESADSEETAMLHLVIKDLLDPLWDVVRMRRGSGSGQPQLVLA